MRTKTNAYSLSRQSTDKAELQTKDDTIAALMRLVGSTPGGESPASAEANRAAAMSALEGACQPAQMDAILQQVANLKLHAAAEQGVTDGVKAIGKGSNHQNLNRMRGEFRKNGAISRLFLLKAALAGELGQSSGRQSLQYHAEDQNKALANLVRLDTTTDRIGASNCETRRQQIEH